MRLTIGRIDPEDEEVEFVDTLMSPERSIFSSKKLIPGEYIILVEVYWEQESHMDITLGTYSQGPVILEMLKNNDNLYTMTEYMIWKSFANQKRSELTKMNPNYIYDKGVNVTVDANKYKNQNYAMVLYDYLNTSPQLTAHQVIGIAKSSGFDVVSAVKNGQNCDLIMNPGENDVILFKMDPRSQGFSLSHRVVQEELLEKNFSKPYQSVFEMLNELGSIDANPNAPLKMDSAGMQGLTQHLKDQMLREQKMKSKAEKIRKMKEAEQKRKKKIENQRKKQYHKSKLGKYDPMNLIFGFKGGTNDIVSLLEQQGCSRGWEQWGRRQERSGKGLFSNFAGLEGFGGLNMLLGGLGLGRGGGMGGGMGGMRGFRGLGGMGLRGGGSQGHRSPALNERGRSPMFQQQVVYHYTDPQGNSGGYSYNLSNNNSPNKSKINQDHFGKNRDDRIQNAKSPKKNQIQNPINGKNSVFKNKQDSKEIREKEINCGCIPN